MKSFGMTLLSLILGSISASGNTAELAFPEKTIRLVVPYPPGAASDVLGRLIGSKLSEYWGQQAIVDNKGGAGTIIGTDVVAKAPPDGYTVLVTTPAFATNATVMQKLPYNTLRDFLPISLFASTTLIIVAHPGLPARTMKELMDLAKAKPGQITYASAGNGTINHLGFEQFRLYGTNMTHVPYKGGAAALTDVAGGHVHLYMSSIIAAHPLIKAGRLRALAVTTPQRSSLYPDVPTVAETVPGYELINWTGLIAPASTPTSIVLKYNEGISRMLREADVKDTLAQGGAEPVGSSSSQFSAFIKNEVERWAKVAKETGAKVD